MSKKRPKGRLDFGKYDEIQLQKIEVPAEPDTTLSLKLICQERHSTSKCSYHQLKSFSDKLRIITSVSWSAITSSPRTTNGYEVMPRTSLVRSIPDGVPPSAEIFVFRFGGGSGSKHSGRIAGYKAGSTFYLLFVDSQMDLYDHGS